MDECVSRLQISLCALNIDNVMRSEGCRQYLYPFKRRLSGVLELKSATRVLRAIRIFRAKVRTTALVGPGIGTDEANGLRVTQNAGEGLACLLRRYDLDD